MHLSKAVLLQHISKGLISGYGDVESQLTANGFDVRLAGIVEVLHGGRLALSKEHHRPPTLGRGWALQGFEQRLGGYGRVAVASQTVVPLKRLQPYLAVTCETVDTPPHLMLHITARSSLFRLTQSLLGCSFGEAGYKGFLTFMLIPFLDSEIELGARFAQLSFSELKGQAHYDDQKETNYQGGRLF